ncbi:MAG: type pilus assembly protein PilV [Burkholderiales bacterium]|jgi:type IV pilus assembly protein PilV
MLEGLIAILIFSFGILALVGLLGMSVKDTTNAKYRTDASLLAGEVIGQMWVGDKSNTALAASFSDPAGAGYLAWKAKVIATLPGITDAAPGANLPTIAIGADNKVTVTVRWKAPGESGAHNYVAITRITG